MKYTIGSCVMVVGLIFGITWAVQGNDFFLTKVFAPRYEAVRRQTFEQSKAYKEGMAQELASMQLDYGKAKTPAERGAIRSIVLHRYAGYDTNGLSPDLQQFLAAMKAGGAL